MKTLYEKNQNYIKKLKFHYTEGYWELNQQEFFQFPIPISLIFFELMKIIHAIMINYLSKSHIFLTQLCSGKVIIVLEIKYKCRMLLSDLKFKISL